MEAIYPEKMDPPEIGIVFYPTCKCWDRATRVNSVDHGQDHDKLQNMAFDLGLITKIRLFKYTGNFNSKN